MNYSSILVQGNITRNKVIIKTLKQEYPKKVGRLPAETTIRDSHHHKSLIRRTQDLNQHRTCAENLLSEVGKYSKPLHQGGTHIEIYLILIKRI